MTEKEVDRLYARFLEGETTMQEERLLSDWMQSGDCPRGWPKQREILLLLLPQSGTSLPQGTFGQLHRMLNEQAYPKSSGLPVVKKLCLALSAVAAVVILFFCLFRFSDRATPVAPPSHLRCQNRKTVVSRTVTHERKPEVYACPKGSLNAKSHKVKIPCRASSVNWEKLRHEEDLLDMAVREEQAQLQLTLSRLDAEAERYVLETIAPDSTTKPTDNEDAANEMENSVTHRI